MKQLVQFRMFHSSSNNIFRYVRENAASAREPGIECTNCLALILKNESKGSGKMDIKTADKSGNTVLV